MQIPDITKLTWPLNVALIGAVFSVFALIYNIHYIYYGFITFVYGIICHLIDAIGSFWLESSSQKYNFVFISQISLTVFWIVFLLIIYK